MAEDRRTEEEKTKVEDQAEEEMDTQSDRKKMRLLIGGALAILTIAVVVLAGCMIYSQNLNHKLALKTSELQEEYKKLQASIEESGNETEESQEPKPTEAGEPTPSPTEEPTPGPASDNLEAVEQNMQQGAAELPNNDGTEPAPEEGGDKVINTPDNPEEFATFEGYIEGKKYTFQYPSEWDGRVIFANVTNEDGTVVVTCYQGGQYADNQNGASESGEIFHILINKDPAYQSPANDQYKISEKDGYCAYYEEPSGVTYDYVNHKEYAQDYKMVYESQAKVWRTFQFN